MKIQFKGKRKNGVEFIKGDLNHIDGKVFIFDRSSSAPLNSPDWFEVEESSVIPLFDSPVILIEYNNDGTVSYTPYKMSDVELFGLLELTKQMAIQERNKFIENKK